MYHNKLIILSIIFFLFTGLGISYCQEFGGAFGLDFGYISPLGDWNKHVYAEGVNQFNGGILYGAEIEFTLLELSGGMFFNYSSLDLSDWENYVEQRGDYIRASASMMNFGLLFKYYALKVPLHLINIDIGIGYTHLEGSESYLDKNYNYDFIRTKSKITLILGLAYKYKMDKRIALTIGGRIIIIPTGIQYATGKKHDILALPLYLGIRYLF